MALIVNITTMNLNHQLCVMATKLVVTILVFAAAKKSLKSVAVNNLTTDFLTKYVLMLIMFMVISLSTVLATRVKSNIEYSFQYQSHYYRLIVIISPLNLLTAFYVILLSTTS